MVKSRRFCHAFALAVILQQPLAALEVTLDPGNIARGGSIVTLPSGKDYPPTGAFQDTSEQLYPYQVLPDGKVTLLIPSMPAGEKRTLSLTEYKQSPQDGATATHAEGQVKFTLGGKPVATYQATARDAPRPDLNPLFLRGGYLHPLTTPAGKVITDDYALNHLHHHGVWMAWTKTRYDNREPDFWNMGQGKGKVDFVSLENTWSGPIEAGLIAKHQYTDLTGPSPIKVLDETWNVHVYQLGMPYYVLDLECAQHTSTPLPLMLPIYHYGGLGVRGLEAWNGKDSVNFITSENETNREAANGKPARWIAMSGAADGATAGMAILSHPENFRSPQPVRVHPSEPFISFAPQTNEAMVIEPSETYRAKYRFILFDGTPDTKLIDALWQDYAHPVIATWSK